MKEQPLGDAFIELDTLRFTLKREMESGQTELDREYGLIFVSPVEIAKVKLGYFHKTGQLVKSDAVENRGKWVDPDKD